MAREPARAVLTNGVGQFGRSTHEVDPLAPPSHGAAPFAHEGITLLEQRLEHRVRSRPRDARLQPLMQPSRSPLDGGLPAPRIRRANHHRPRVVTNVADEQHAVVTHHRQRLVGRSDQAARERATTRSAYSMQPTEKSGAMPSAGTPLSKAASKRTT